MKKDMKHILVAVGCSFVLTGCLSSTAPQVAQWNIEYTTPALQAPQSPKLPIARLSQVVVRAPYNGVGIAVLRADGSLAFDPYNEYAALPVQIAKGAAFEALAASGRFETVVGASSIARAPISIEMVVSRLALDCRTEGTRKAVAEVVLRLLRDREIVALVKGNGAVDAADGNYGAAFSKAFTESLVMALGQIK